MYLGANKFDRIEVGTYDRNHMNCFQFFDMGLTLNLLFPLVLPMCHNYTWPVIREGEGKGYTLHNSL